MKKILTFALRALEGFLSTLFIFFILYSVIVFAYPQVGHQFYGYAGSGSTVTAKVSGYTYSTSVQSDGYYGYDSIFFIDAGSDDMTGAEDGDTITFYLDGTAVATEIFAIGGVTKLDFATDPGTLSTSSTDTSSTSTSSSSSSSSSDTNNGDDSKSSSSSGSDNDETTTSEISCSHKWDCTDWSDCAENGFQTRVCYYVGTCSQEGNKPDFRQYCTYIPEEVVLYIPKQPTCSDSIKNQGEKEIDCGGPCNACAAAVTPPVGESKTSWMYIGLGIFLLLLIAAVILAHKYKDKLLPYWENFKRKLGIKPKPTPIGAVLQQPAYSQYQQQYRQPYLQNRR